MRTDLLLIAGTVSAVAWACSSSADVPPTATRSLEDASPPNLMLVVGAGRASGASVHSALLTGLSPAALGFDPDPEDPGKEALHSTLFPEVRIFPEVLRRAGYFTVRRGPARHNLSAGGVDPADELAQPGLLGAWDMAGADANWRRTLGESCTVGFGCGHVLVELVPGQEDTVDPDKPFFMLVNTVSDPHRATAEIDHLLAELDADGMVDDTIVLVVDLAEPGGPVVGAWRGRAADGMVPDAPVSVLDIAPTVLSLAGVPAPSYMIGQTIIRPDGTMTLPSDAAARGSDQHVEALPWADGSPPVAASPDGRPTGGLFHVAPYVTLRCDTDGSTIVYTTELAPPFYWRLYRGPFRMRFWTLHAQCGRLGYLDSDVVAYEFDIE